MIFWQLFRIFFMIGMFSFGGGYAMLPLIQDEIVARNHWITNARFVDIVAVSQVTPGPLAVNAATYVGFAVTQSVWGAVCATAGVCLPSIIVVVFLYLFMQKFKEAAWLKNMFKGLKIGVVGLILGAALILMTPEIFADYISVLLCVASFVACYRFNQSPITVISAAAVAGMLIY